jgi:ribulose kinase
MTWKQGFLSGVVVAITVSVLSPVVQYVSYTYISPEFFANIIKYAVDHKVQTQTQAESYFNLRSYITQGIFSSLSMGVIAAAIVAQFLKTKNDSK